MSSLPPIPVPLLDGDTFVIDNSSIEHFCTCPRLAQFTISRRLRPAGERVPLKFGGILHRVLETRYRSSVPMFEQTPEVTAAMVAVAEEEFVKWSPPEDDYRTFDTMVRFIEKYGETYHFEDFDLAQIDGRPAVEVAFALPLGTITLSSGKVVKILFTGRIDLIYRTQYGTYLMDHKSASIATNMAEFELSHQFQGYTWAAETILGCPISGVCINRCVIRKPTRTGDPFTFERRLIPTVPSRVLDWRTDMLHIIADFLEMCLRGHLPKHTSWCVSKFGTCPFHPVCLLPSDDQRELLLTSGEYEHNDWSPLK